LRAGLPYDVGMRTVLGLFAAALIVGSGTAATAPTPPRLTAVRFVDARHGWAAGPGAILATGDGGRTWSRQYRGGAAFRSLEFVDTRHGWAVAGRKLLRTSDGGETWVAAGEPPRPLERVDFVTPSLGWGTGGRLL